MKNKGWIRFCTVLIILMSFVGFAPRAAALPPDAGLPVLRGEVRARIPSLFVASDTEVTAKPEKLTVGGGTFGVRLFAEGVLVVGVSDTASPAAQAGLQKKDRILEIDGKTVQTVSDVVNAVEQCGGKSLSLRCRRGEKEVTLTLTPVKDASDKYKAGIWVRDNAAGIGTVTFINPKTGAFGGLGHGICDADTGELLPLTRGAVMETEINGVVRGTEGTPGELKGFLGSKKLGTLLRNCERGVFGIFSPLPDGMSDCMEIAERDAVHDGEAFLRCTLSDGAPEQYRIELSDVRHDNTSTKCFAVHITDPALIEATGGIVQGMSGSPIIQDGKLIGAVTHVLVGDPTRGYGIFLENMLAAMPAELS